MRDTSDKLSRRLCTNVFIIIVLFIIIIIIISILCFYFVLYLKLSHTKLTDFL